ncbi:MAG: sigma factor-like helix-turn-helix DNA-binding protein, partial [Myxococcota bacterium]
ATGPSSDPVGEVKVLEREVRLACTQSMLLTLSRQERIAVVLVEVLGASVAIGAEISEVSAEAFRQRLSRAKAKLRPVLEERCGLANPQHACRCRRQAAAKQQAGLERRRWTRLPVLTADEVSSAQAQLQAAHRWGPVFAWNPPIAPPRTLWGTLAPRLRAIL